MHGLKGGTWIHSSALSDQLPAKLALPQMQRAREFMQQVRSLHSRVSPALGLVQGVSDHHQLPQDARSNDQLHVTIMPKC